MTQKLCKDDMRFHTPGEPLPRGFKKYAAGEKGDPDIIVREGSKAEKLSVIAFAEAIKAIPEGQNGIELDI